MRRSKYGNKKVTHNGYKFDSKKEGLRFLELSEMVRRKEISDLSLQAPYTIQINGMIVCKYVADFVYLKDGNVIVEDVKGFKTDIYRMKKKLMKAVHNIEIFET